MDFFKLGKENVKAVNCHTVYLTFMKSTSCEILGLMNHKLESRLLGELSITSDMQIYCLYGRKWRGSKDPFDEAKRVEWKSWPKTQYLKKSKIMVSVPITSWQTDWKTLKDFIFLGSKITADGDCNCKIKRCSLLVRKTMTKLVY